MALEDQVADITAWQNNCALSCVSIFLVNAFLDKKLSEKVEMKLVDLFNNYYGTSFDILGLKSFFEKIITFPSDRQVVLGPVLRDFITKEGIEFEEDNMLSNEAFRPLAEAFGFNVVFYVKRDTGIGESIVIPPITIDNFSKLVLKPYYHESHYDLIMDDQKEAYKHNQSSFEVSPHKLPIEKGKELKS